MLYLSLDLDLAMEYITIQIYRNLLTSIGLKRQTISIFPVVNLKIETILGWFGAVNKKKLNYQLVII